MRKRLLLCVVGASVAGCSSPQHVPRIGNTSADDREPSETLAIRLVLPVPATMTGTVEATVPAEGEVVIRQTLCSADGSVVDGDAWVGPLAEDGFEVQKGDDGLVNGTLTVRFRRAAVIGDVYGNLDLKGCRDYVFRFMRVNGTRMLRWESSFGPAFFKHEFAYCLRFFSPDERFPFGESEYSWGCTNR